MEYYKPLLTLLISLIIFHLLFIWLFPQSKKFWKKIDYLWISLGIVGIIGSTYSLRREYSNVRNNWHVHFLKQDYYGLTESVNWNVKYFDEGETSFDYTKFENQNEVEKYKKAGMYFKDLSILTQRLKDTILVDKEFEYIDSIKINFKNFINSINDDYIIQTSESVDYYLNELESSKNEYLQNQSLGNRNSLDWILLFLSPYLFAIAISIRLTKVTAEIKELK